ncbi:MAG: hypothetical protein Kow00114_23580 [Kiloniellaceae bacterium]
MNARKENACRENMAISPNFIQGNISGDAGGDRNEGEENLYSRNEETDPFLNRHAEDGVRVSVSYKDQKSVCAGHRELEEGGIANRRVLLGWHVSHFFDWQCKIDCKPSKS